MLARKEAAVVKKPVSVAAKAPKVDPQRRDEFAKAALAGLSANPEVVTRGTVEKSEWIAALAARIADATIAELG